MKLPKYLMAAAALSLAASPALAAPAAPSTHAIGDSARVGSSKGDQNLAGGGVFVAIIAAVAVIVGIIIVADNKDKPNSP